MALSGAGFSEESQETGSRVELEGHLSFLPSVPSPGSSAGSLELSDPFF